MKTCTICNKTKEYNEFGVLSRSTDGHYPQCKSCKSIIDKEYYNKRREVIKENANKYYKNNRESVLNTRNKNKDHYNQYNKIYKKENAENIKQYNKNYKDKYKDRRNKIRTEKKKTNPH